MLLVPSKFASILSFLGNDLTFSGTFCFSNLGGGGGVGNLTWPMMVSTTLVSFGTTAVSRYRCLTLRFITDSELRIEPLGILLDAERRFADESSSVRSMVPPLVEGRGRFWPAVGLVRVGAGETVTEGELRAVAVVGKGDRGWLDRLMVTGTADWTWLGMDARDTGITFWILF